MPEDRARSLRSLRPILFAALIGLVLAPSLAPLQAGRAAAEEPQPAAVFDFELQDTSLEGELRGRNPAETRRIAMVSGLLRSLMEESGRYRVLDLAPVARDIEQAGYLSGCNGCDADIARKLGAALSVTGVVQKVSNLILNINLYVRDAGTGELRRVMSADIRGNTDRSWERGVRWLVRNRLLKR